jgi:hypothetical protein
MNKQSIIKPPNLIPHGNTNQIGNHSYQHPDMTKISLFINLLFLSRRVIYARTNGKRKGFTKKNQRKMQ